MNKSPKLTSYASNLSLPQITAYKSEVQKSNIGTVKYYE